MRDSQKNTLIAVISGIVACIVCVGVMFTFPTNKSNLKGNDTKLPNNQEEINLGDDPVCYGSWQVNGDYGDYVGGTCTVTSDPTDSTPGVSYTQCSDNHSPGSNECPSQYMAEGCHKARTWSRQEQPCPADAPVITCRGAVFNGEGQTVATCANGNITSGGIGRNATTYNVRCEGDGGITTKSCSISKATPTITFGGFSLTPGSSRELGATSSIPACGTITYNLAGGTSVILDGEGVTATSNLGSSTIRAISPESSNCNQVTKDAVINVVNPTATITCFDITYNTHTQRIAECDGGEISSGENEMTAGTHLVTCVPDDGSANITKICTIKKANNSITGANNLDLKVGQTGTLSATATAGTITYSIKSGNAVTLSGTTVTAVKVGTSTIEATTDGDSNYKGATATITVQVSACPAGQGADPSSPTGCKDCSPGYYSPADDSQCHKCENNEFSVAGAASCETVSAPCCENPYETPHQIDDLSGCRQAVTAGATVLPGACPTTTNIVVTSVSSSGSGTVYLNPASYNYEIDSTHSGGQYGFKTVTYVAYDQNHSVIDGTKLNWNYNITGNAARVVAANANSNGYVVTYRGIQCTSGTSTVSATATGKGGATGAATSATMTIVTLKYNKWTRSNWNKENSSGWPLLSNAETTDSCDAVSDSYVENGVTKYRYRYNRCGCGGGGTTYSFCCVKNDGSGQSWLTGQSSKTCPGDSHIDETKNASTCIKTFACYMDSDNRPHWTSDPQPSWVVVSKPEQECKDQEACFEDPTGQRFWGKHYDKIAQGYILITSIKDEDSCKNPSNDDACYINNDDATDYRWSKTALQGYTKLNNIKSAKECQPEACYIEKDKNEFAFGKYKDNDKYIPVYKTIEVDGEYKDVLIIDKNECTTEVPVGPTDFDVTKLVYVFMAILMACGIAFIYYSSVAKKQDQQ